MFSNKDLKRLIFPLILEQLFGVMIGMADTVMVTSVGEAAVSGIALVDSINVLLINIFSALATGGAVVSSQYLGRQEDENASRAAKQLIYASFAVALLISALTLIANRPILQLVFGKIDGNVMTNAQTYFYLSAVSYPFLALYNAGAALFRAMGNSKVSLLISIMMNIVNIAGNAILIYGAGIGVAGAGIATLLSRALGGVVVLVLLQKRRNRIYIRNLFKPELQFSMIRSILKVGIPNGLENGMFQVGKILVSSLVASFGTAAIAANAIAGSISGLSILPGSAIGLAMITVTGQCVGAGEYDQAKQYTLKMMKMAYLFIWVINIFLLIFNKTVVGFFHLEPGTTAVAAQLIFFYCACVLFFWPTSFTLPNSLRAAGDAKFTMVVSIVSMWTCRIGFSYILAAGLGMGVMGVWVAMVLDWIVRSSFFVTRFLGGKWRNKQVI